MEEGVGEEEGCSMGLLIITGITVIAAWSEPGQNALYSPHPSTKAYSQQKGNFSPSKVEKK